MCDMFQAIFHANAHSPVCICAAVDRHTDKTCVDDKLVEKIKRITLAANCQIAEES
jgi:hypothetical protein